MGVPKTRAHQRHHNAQGQDLLIPPKHLSACGFRAPPERQTLAGHGVRLIDEQLDPLATREDLFDVVDHDVLDLVQLCLRLVQRIGVLRRGGGGVLLRVVLVEKRGESGSEGGLEGVCGSGWRRVGSYELALERGKE